MGWYETAFYQSAAPQIKETAGAILKDPYLMPPTPLFWPVFDDLASGDTDGAQFRVEGILESVIWQIHHDINQIGDTDLSINLLDFWKFLVQTGVKSGYEYFEGPGRHSPIAIWARAAYCKAVDRLKERAPAFILSCPEKTMERRMNMGEQFLRALGYAGEYPPPASWYQSGEAPDLKMRVSE